MTYLADIQTNQLNHKSKMQENQNKEEPRDITTSISNDNQVRVKNILDGAFLLKSQTIFLGTNRK